MSDQWEIVGWVLPNENMTPYLLDPEHIYRILVPVGGASGICDVHHLPLGPAGHRGVLIQRAAELPAVVPGAVRDRPCSLEWADERRKRQR